MRREEQETKNDQAHNMGEQGVQVVGHTVGE